MLEHFVMDFLFWIIVLIHSYVLLKLGLFGYSNIHNNPLFELLMASLILGKRRDYIYGKTEYRSTWQKKDYLRLRNKANQNET